MINDKSIAFFIHSLTCQLLVFFSATLSFPISINPIVSLIGLSNDTWMTGNVIRVDGGEDIVG